MNFQTCKIFATRRPDFGICNSTRFHLLTTIICQTILWAMLVPKHFAINYTQRHSSCCWVMHYLQHHSTNVDENYTFVSLMYLWGGRKPLPRTDKRTLLQEWNQPTQRPFDISPVVLHECLQSSALLAVSDVLMGLWLRNWLSHFRSARLQCCRQNCAERGTNDQLYFPPTQEPLAKVAYTVNHVEGVDSVPPMSTTVYIIKTIHTPTPVGYNAKRNNIRQFEVVS